MTELHAFVIMPFGDDFDDVFSNLIAPGLTTNGYRVDRADLSIDQGQILRDIIRMLISSDLVIADVTGLNPNVMYELGLAHAMDCKTVLITRDISELPFDLRAYRAHEYSVHFAEAANLKDKISEIAAMAANGEVQFSNPVIDFAPELKVFNSASVTRPALSLRTAEEARKKDSESGTGAETAISEIATIEIEGHDSPGLIDYIVELNIWGESTVTITSRIADATKKLGQQIESRTAELEKARQKLGNKGAVVYQKIMKETAEEVAEFASEIEMETPQLKSSLDGMIASANGLAQSRADASTQQELDSIRAEIESIAGSEQIFSDASGSMTNFAESLLGVQNLERTMTQASRRASSAVSEAAKIIDQGKTDLSRVRGILESRIAS